MFPESVSEILVSTKMETKNGWIHLPDIGKAQPDLYSRQFCCGGWWVSWHISNGAKLMESQKSGKIGSFFKVWSSAFRRVSSQSFAGSQNLPITLPWSFRNFSDLGSNVPQLSKLFFIWRFEEAYDWVSGGLDPKAAKEWIFFVKFPTSTRPRFEWSLHCCRQCYHSCRAKARSRIDSMKLKSQVWMAQWFTGHRLGEVYRCLLVYYLYYIDYFWDKSEWSSSDTLNASSLDEFLKDKPKASSTRSTAGHQWCHGHHAAPEWQWVLTVATVLTVQRKEGKVDVCRGPAGSPKWRGGTYLNIDP